MRCSSSEHGTGAEGPVEEECRGTRFGVQKPERECHSRELFDAQAAFGTTKAAQAFVLSVSTAFVAVLLIYLGWSGAATQKTACRIAVRRGK